MRGFETAKQLPPLVESLMGRAISHAGSLRLMPCRSAFCWVIRYYWSGMWSKCVHRLTLQLHRFSKTIFDGVIQHEQKTIADVFQNNVEHDFFMRRSEILQGGMISKCIPLCPGAQHCELFKYKSVHGDSTNIECLMWLLLGQLFSEFPCRCFSSIQYCLNRNLFTWDQVYVIASPVIKLIKIPI